jgi:hypothetical protein
MRYSDELLTRFLLDELSESERAELEAEYFADPHAFNHLEHIETDLIDDYAHGRLDRQTRTRFERAYLANPNRRARLKFAETLAARPAQRQGSVETSALDSSWWRKPVWLLRSHRPVLAFSLVMALSLLVLGTVLLLMQSNRLRADLARLEASRAREQEYEAELQRQLADEQKRSQELRAALERASNSSASQTGPSAGATPAFVSLLLTVSGIRGAEPAPPATLVIPKGTEQVHLQLTFKDTDYLEYQIVLRAIGGAEILNRRNLKLNINRAGATFTVSLPASKFAGGDYMLTLRGASQSGDFEDVSKSLFRVEKR